MSLILCYTLFHLSVVRMKQKKLGLVLIAVLRYRLITEKGIILKQRILRLPKLEVVLEFDIIIRKIGKKIVLYPYIINK